MSLADLCSQVYSMEMQPAVLPPHFGGETFCPARCCHYSGGLFFPYNDRAIGCKNEDCAEPQNMSTSGASRVGSHLAAFKTWFPLAAVSVFATSLAACGGGTGTPATTTPTPPVSCSGSTSSVVPVAKAAAPAFAAILWHAHRCGGDRHPSHVGMACHPFWHDPDALNRDPLE